MAVGFPARFTHRLVSSANSANATLIVGNRATVFKIRARNTTGAVVYLKLYDKPTAPAVGDTTLLRMVIPLEPGLQLIDDFAHGEEFANGLGYRIVTGNADADDTAVAAGAVTALNISYT